MDENVMYKMAMAYKNEVYRANGSCSVSIEDNKIMCKSTHGVFQVEEGGDKEIDAVSVLREMIEC